MKRYIYIALFVVLVIWILRIAYRDARDKKGYVLKRGDTYAEVLPKIKNDYRFLFRIASDKSVYKAFSHTDYDNTLLFGDDILMYIGTGPHLDDELGLFKDRNTGESHRIHFNSYINPFSYAKLLIKGVGNSMEKHVVRRYAVDGRRDFRGIDWGLTAAVLIAYAITRPIIFFIPKEQTLADRFGYAFEDIPLFAKRETILGVLGDPAYVDAESGVEYYDRFGFMGIAYSNEIVNAVFSKKMLDYRITCKQGGLEFQKVIDSR